MPSKPVKDESILLVSPPKINLNHKIPARIGAVSDEYYQTRQTRLAFQKLVDALKERESALKEHLINNVSKTDSTGAVGKLARCQIVPKQTYQPEDWDLIWKYIIKEEAYDLLQRRLSIEAVDERWQMAKSNPKRRSTKPPIPGIVEFDYKDVSVNKL